MAETDLTELQLEISEEGTAPEDIDEMTRQLLSELRETDVETVRLAPGRPAPAGSKAIDPVAAGTIVMTVLPAVLPKIIDVVQSWMTRGSGRTIKFKGKVGKQDIEFEGPPEELQKLITTLERDRKR